MDLPVEILPKIIRFNISVLYALIQTCKKWSLSLRNYAEEVRQKTCTDIILDTIRGRFKLLKIYNAYPRTIKISGEEIEVLQIDVPENPVCTCAISLSKNKNTCFGACIAAYGYDTPAYYELVIQEKCMSGYNKHGPCYTWIADCIKICMYVRPPISRYLAVLYLNNRVHSLLEPINCKYTIYQLLQNNTYYLSHLS